MTFRPRRTPWQIDEDEFYELETRKEQIDFLLRYAVLAPSTHNTQPWMFHVTDDGIEVYADYSRRLPFADPADRELLMSVGAAITNFRVAAAWFGFETTTLYETRPEDSLPVALIAIRETCAADEDLRRLVPAIRKRHTVRSAFTTEPLPPDATSAMCDLVERYPETLRLLRQSDRAWIADIVADGEQQLMAREPWRNELADWLRAPDGEAADGICTDSFGIRAPFAATEWVIRNMDLGQVQAKRDRERVEGASALVLVTADEDRTSLVNAGEILERLLLTITQQGLQYSFLNQPIQAGSLRTKLQATTLTSRPPQLLLCVGIAEQRTQPAPRRPVEAVVF